MDYAFIRRQKIGQELREIGLVYLIGGIFAVLAIMAVPAISFLA